MKINFIVVCCHSFVGEKQKNGGPIYLADEKDKLTEGLQNNDSFIEVLWDIHMHVPKVIAESCSFILF